MAIYKVARYDIRPESREPAERAMHELASYIRKELPGTMWNVYRAASTPGRYLALTRSEDKTAEDRHRDAPGVHAFVSTLAPLLVGEGDTDQYELVTSTDLQRRHR